MDSLLVPYARAVYNVATECLATEEWLLLLDELSAAISKPIIADFLANPELTLQNKASLLSNWLKQAEYPEQLARFVETLVLNNKISKLSVVRELVQQEHDKASNVKRILVTQAIDLPESYKAKFITWLEAKFAGSVVPTWQVDSNLIGGFIVKSGDTVYDYSLRVRLNQIKKVILGK